MDAFESMGADPVAHTVLLTAPWGRKHIEWHRVRHSSAARHEMGRRYNMGLVDQDPLWFGWTWEYA